jgi:hypothetical protein
MQQEVHENKIVIWSRYWAAQKAVGRNLPRDWLRKDLRRISPQIL